MRKKRKTKAVRIHEEDSKVVHVEPAGQDVRVEITKSDPKRRGLWIGMSIEDDQS